MTGELTALVFGETFETGSVTLRIEDKDSIIAITRYDVDPETLDEIRDNGVDASTLSDKSRDLIHNAKAELDKATEEFIRSLKYYLDCDSRISESKTFRGPTRIEWSVDQASWEKCPYDLHGGHAVMRIKENPDFDVRTHLHNSLAEPRYFPYAMRMLNRAKLTQDIHFRCLDATIAAEHAVKEFLATKAPTLQALLFEVPSPPLVKLYGSILEYYAGERSPYLGSIRKGVEIRNVLAHKPSPVTITPQFAVEYVRDIELAILHLLRLLYPSDAVIRYQYEDKLKCKQAHEEQLPREIADKRL
ncbi:MAG: hypothetical protein KDB00_02985 [Planctomycetales bacterium]|nr:hypothetical protein [Planctomycetales bacterium]